MLDGFLKLKPQGSSVPLDSPFRVDFSVLLLHFLQKMYLYKALFYYTSSAMSLTYFIIIEYFQDETSAAHIVSLYNCVGVSLFLFIIPSWLWVNEKRWLQKDVLYWLFYMCTKQPKSGFSTSPPERLDETLFSAKDKVALIINLCVLAELSSWTSLSLSFRLLLIPVFLNL